MVTLTNGWRRSTIGSMCAIRTGSSDTQDATPNGRYPFFVRSNNIEHKDSYEFDTEAVLTAGDGVGTGKVFHYVKGRFAAHQRVYVMSDFNGVDGRYFYYFFSNRFLSEVQKYTAKSSVDSVRRPMIAEMEIDLPTLPEQRAIADVLAGFDEHLANLDAFIAKKKAIRDGALEELVNGTRRIPGFSQPWRVINFVEEIIPKARIGWQGLKAGEYLRSGYSFLISGTDFEDGHVSTKKISFVSKERYEMDTAIQVQAGDVLVSKDGTIGKVALVPDLGMPATLNSGVFVFRPHSSLAREFLYWVLMSSVFRAFINTLAAGSTIKHLYQKDLADFSFSAPATESEQICISEALFAMDAEIASLVEERAKVERLKQGAMEDLLTGRVRLPVHEEAL